MGWLGAEWLSYAYGFGGGVTGRKLGVGVGGRGEGTEYLNFCLNLSKRLPNFYDFVFMRVYLTDTSLICNRNNSSKLCDELSCDHHYCLPSFISVRVSVLRSSDETFPYTGNCVLMFSDVPDFVRGEHRMFCMKG